MPMATDGVKQLLWAKEANRSAGDMVTVQLNNLLPTKLVKHSPTKHATTSHLVGTREILDLDIAGAVGDKITAVGRNAARGAGINDQRDVIGVLKGVVDTANDDWIAAYVFKHSLPKVEVAVP